MRQAHRPEDRRPGRKASRSAGLAPDIMVGRHGCQASLRAFRIPHDGRFLDIIGRRNGYDGYGVGDAPVRLAALADWQRRHPPAP